MGEALQYPFDDEDWIIKILIGGGLNLVSVLVVPVFFLVGYQLRVLERGMTSGKTLPEFDEWADMFTTGLTGVGISLAYLLPAFFFLVPGGMLRGIGFLLVLVALFLIPAGLANFVRRGTFRDGLDFGSVLAIARDSEYITHWIMAGALGVVGAVIAGILQVVLVGFLVQFYFNLAIFYLLGRGITRAT